MKINPDGEVNWQLKIQVGANNSIKCKTIQNVQAESMGVPSKIKAVKVFDANEVELTDVVVTNSDDPPEVSKKQKTETETQKIKSVLFSFRASSQELGKRQQICNHLSSCTEPTKIQQICLSPTFSGAKTTMLI